MKKLFAVCLLLMGISALMTIPALADTGPKPQLTVRVTNAPEGRYYLDLLEEGEYEGHTYGSGRSEYSGLDWSYSAEELSLLDKALLEALRAAVPEGWHACTAEGTNGAPRWGDLAGEDTGAPGVRLHTFRYFGVPETYRIILVTADGESWVSGPCTRRGLQSSVTVDWAARSVSVPPVGRAYLLQFICTLLPTVLIEGAVLFLFGYRAKQSYLRALLINLVTQGCFAAYLAVTIVQNGFSLWGLLLYIPAEIAITLAEAAADVRLLTEHSKKRAFFYAAAANACSALLGWNLLEPIWRFLVTIS